jgi:D-alanine--poly(phosphoribitol) ligase subunit 1
MVPFDFLERIAQNLLEKRERRAFYIGGTGYTYGELASAIAEIQSALKAEKVGNGHVGVYLADDIHTYASILALWMSGRAFVPVNPLFPAARNRKIMEQLGLRWVLHSREMDPGVMIPGCRALHTGAIDLKSDRKPVLDKYTRERDAYVLFTSGSTGNPKGVRISFQNLYAFVRDFINYPAYSFTPEDRFLQIYDLSFDGSVPCYTVPLAIGASVHTVPPDGIKYLAAYKLIHEQRLTFVKMPPSTLSYLRPYFSSIRLPVVKYCLLGGEALPTLLAGEWEPCVPNALIQNVYGPTEATVNCLIYDWNGPGSQRKELNGIASIGKVFGTNRALVISENGALAKPGETGELLVAGDQVSPGYWKDEKLNEKAYVQLDMEGETLRFYRTGDVVTVDGDGDVMFIGRNDEQVQVRGYRVELGEIESLARAFLDGKNVMAIGRDQGMGEMKIFLAVESVEVDPLPLRGHLQEHLPSYMIPDRILCIPHFPRLVSGKLDRKALSEMISE